jgi:hypothetical protein
VDHSVGNTVTAFASAGSLGIDGRSAEATRIAFQR